MNEGELGQEKTIRFTHLFTRTQHVIFNILASWKEIKANKPKNNMPPQQFNVGFGLLLYVTVNSYGHVGMVSTPNHTFFLGKLEQAVDQCLVHILPLVTDNPS